MIIKEIHELVVIPTLQAIGLGGANANYLVTLTGYHESKYRHLKQQPGPALSFWQIEPNTEADNKKWLKNGLNNKLLERILAVCFLDTLPFNSELLVFNLRYAVCMSRICYRRSPKELPDYRDVESMAQYYCKNYNRGGKAVLSDVIENFKVASNEIDRS